MLKDSSLSVYLRTFGIAAACAGLLTVSACSDDQTEAVSEPMEETQDTAPVVAEPAQEPAADTAEPTEESSEGAWDKTKEASSDAWDKTKEVSSEAWDATKEEAKKPPVADDTEKAKIEDR